MSPQSKMQYKRVPFWCSVSIVLIGKIYLAGYGITLAQSPTDRPPGTDISEERLIASMQGANRVVVLEGIFEGAKKLFESRDSSHIESLKSALALAPIKEPFRCSCYGSVSVFLYRDEKLLISITDQHSVAIRVSIWNSDVMLANPEAWVSWFEKIGIDQVRAAYAERLAKDNMPVDEMQERYGKWTGAMPGCLLQLYVQSPDVFDRQDIDAIHFSLRSSLPEISAQVLALLSWYGEVTVDWFHDPANEDIVPAMFSRYIFRDIISAAQSRKLDDREVFGLARLFCNRQFGQAHLSEIRTQIPPSLKDILLEHVKKSQDVHKTRKLKEVFEMDAEKGS